MPPPEPPLDEPPLNPDELLLNDDELLLNDDELLLNDDELRLKEDELRFTEVPLLTEVELLPKRLPASYADDLLAVWADDVPYEPLPMYDCDDTREAGLL